jgi:methionyl-tRNA synthetase
MSAFYVTTPIYYVNDYPHIGHMYTTIVTDVVARYHRLAGDDTRFLTGTDEHGQNIERGAKELGIEPLEQANRVAARCRELWEELGISHDDFIRTTEPRHHAGVRAVIERIEAAGDFYTGRHEGWYCSSCETFYTEKELGPDHACPIHERPTEWKSEENVFFRLSKYQQPLLDLYRDNPRFVRPESRLNEVRSFVESGLRDLSASRAELSWGIPFPGKPGQTVYVWLDALTNYISALGFGSDDPSLYEKYWDGGEQRPHRLHLVGKDILRFHAVYWPAFLMSAGLPLPDTVFAHGWWLRDQKKVSKSVGNVVRPDALIERFGPDALRFYLLREMVFGQDASFSDEAFVDRYNSDLANDLGNTVSRLVTLARRAYDGRTPPTACDDNPLQAAAEEAVDTYRREMDELAFHKALDALWKLLAETNQYFVEREPWKLIKSDPESEGLSRVLWNGLEATRIVAVGLLPVMPRVAPRVLAALGFVDRPESLDEAMAWGGTPTSALLPQPEPLFPRIDKDEYLGAAQAPADQAETKPARTAEKGPKASMDDADRLPEIDIETFFNTELRVGTVLEAEPVPKSNKLMKLRVRLSPAGEAPEGEEAGETRQIVAGIAKAYTADELVGKQVVVVANLKPAKLMGVESQGMVLAASEDGRPVLVTPRRGVPDGTRVR